MIQNTKFFLNEFKDKVVLITGGNGQIGQDIVKYYLHCEAVVINLDIEEPTHAWQSIDEKKDKLEYFIKCDITNKDSVVQSIESVIDKFVNIDILINSAGISVFSPFEERTCEEFTHVFDVNIKGMFLVCQKIIQKMLKQENKGVILNLGSIYGHTIADQRIYGDSGRNSPEIYAITKSGVTQFTKYLARYYGKDGIRVNCISPGGIFANQANFFVKNYEYKTPLGRMGNPEDLIGGVAFLTSSMSIYVTGQDLIIDGGFCLGS